MHLFIAPSFLIENKTQDNKKRILNHLGGMGRSAGTFEAVYNLLLVGISELVERYQTLLFSPFLLF